MNASQTLGDLFVQYGSVIDIPLNYRIFLHDEESIIWIEQGDIDIFGLNAQRSQIEKLKENFAEISQKSVPFLGCAYSGNLNFLRSAAAGAILLSFSNVYKVGKPLITAVANSETKLRKLSLQELEQLLASSPQLKQEVDLQIQSWVEGFSPLFLYRKTPKYLLPIAHDIVTQLSANTQAASKKTDAHKIVWLDLSEGVVEIAGLQTLTLGKCGGYYPLSESSWFQTPLPATLELKTIDTVISNPECLSGLKRFNASIIDLLFFNRLLKGRRETQKIRLQESLDETTLASSLNELGSIFNPEDNSTSIVIANHLYRCCQVIGSLMNLKFIPLNFEQEQKFYTAEEYLYHLCRHSHIQYRRATLMEDWSKNDFGPLLCFKTADSLPLVLNPKKGGGYEIYDPEIDQTVPFLQEKYPDIQPSVYVFYRSLPNNEEISNSEIASFAFYGKKWNCFTFIFFAFLGTLVLALSPILSQKLFALVVPNLNYVLFAQIGFGFFMICTSVVVFNICRDYLSIRIETMLDNDLSAALWQRTLSLPATFFRQNRVGDLFSRVQIISYLRTVFTGRTVRKIITAFFSLMFLFPMFYYNTALAIIGVMILFFVIVAQIVVSKILEKLNNISLEQEGELNNKILETLLGINSIRTYGCEKRFFSRWEKDFFRNKQTTWKIAFLKSILSVINVLARPFSMTVIFSFVIYQIVSSNRQFMLSGGAGFLEVGNFMGFYLAFSALSTDLLTSFECFLQFTRAAPAWKRARIFFNQQPEVSSSRSRLDHLIGEIRIDHLKFRYHPQGPWALNDISLRISPGEFVAIVGHSGSGKSTLIRALIGFEVPEGGAIYYDGRDLSTIDLHDLRSQIGIVLQNSSLLDGSIKDNVMAGSIYKESQVIKALDMADFSKDLAELPMGLETLLMNGGGTLSGGQKQKILIARALIGNPKLLIFDEASSALDSETQQIIIKNLEAINTTRIAIAHRLSTIRNADRIYVMDEGKIVQQGTFKELAEQEGLFKKLLKRQSTKTD